MTNERIEELREQGWSEGKIHRLMMEEWAVEKAKQEAERKKFIHSCCTPNKIINIEDFIDHIADAFQPGYGALVCFSYSVGQPTIKEDWENICFVHGNMDQLKKGKKCVIRNQVSICEKIEDDYILQESGEYNNNHYYIGYQKDYPEVGNKVTIWKRTYPDRRFVIHLSDGHVLLFIGQTPNGNAVVVYK